MEGGVGGMADFACGSSVGGGGVSDFAGGS